LRKIFLFFISIFLSTSLNAAAYDEVAVTDKGSVSGQIFFKKKIPQPVILPVKKDPQVCGKEDRIIQDVNVKDGKLGSAIVYLSDIKKGKAFNLPEKGYEINQKKCFFMPNMQVIKKNAAMKVISADSVGHNIHGYEIDGEHKRTLFNIAQPDMGTMVVDKVRVRRSPYVKIECDIHDFMHAWAFVSETPYVSVVDEKGTFEIKDIPPGKYKIKVWNPSLGEIEKEITISKNKESMVSFSF
jgi:hypothetical protein